MGRSNSFHCTSHTAPRLLLSSSYQNSVRELCSHQRQLLGGSSNFLMCALKRDIRRSVLRHQCRHGRFNLRQHENFIDAIALFAKAFVDLTSAKTSLWIRLRSQPNVL
ncbi:hypothetical protein EVAR_2548_1 [Eumeta japonica]|uniref:Uncharacterized protein n=1 Tax=Eumeta variegata TaxID=151549 RepID=A0A4C1SPG6_EUMVA|nr:hypothetical protein EVAR_2548_1 [Eumeta japonica]